MLKPENMVQKSTQSRYPAAAPMASKQAAASSNFSKKGIGFDVGVGLVPIVCGASLFDLVVGDGAVRPDKEMGREACEMLCLASLKKEITVPAQGRISRQIPRSLTV